MELNKIDQVLDDALRKSPDFKLDASYRDRVIQKIKKNQARASLRTYLMLGSVTVFLLSISIGMIYAFKLNEALQDVGKITPMAILFGTVIVIIQYLDKRLLKDKLIKRMA